MSNGSTLFNEQGPQKPHIVPQGASGGLAAEVADLRADLKRVMNKMAPITVDEYTNPLAAVANAIKTAIATVAAPVTYSGAQLNGTVGAAALPIPRNITVTTAGTAADAPATATINGTYRGKPQSEVITVAQTATIANGLKPFDKVTSIVLPAADGTGATLAFGFGVGLGVGLPVKTRAGGAAILREVVDGSLVTTGALTAVGLYTPATAPDGAHDYALYYEFDPAVA